MMVHPTFAIWLLERCKPGSCRDALIGDLLEEIALGRSPGWVWQQVLAFCGFAIVDYVRDQKPPAGLIASAVGFTLVGVFWIAPSSRVFEAWAVVYLTIGSASLFGDMMSRAFDTRPILFSYDVR